MKNRNAFEDKSEKYKKELFDCLRKKRGFFFTGSGISIESGIAKVEDVLKHTCNKFLAGFDNDYSFVPQKMSRKDYICEGVQPELFYSILLECTEKERVLEMWNCLKRDHFTSSYCPQPNIIHYFIVAYSYFANIPIFTMNYDKMFEDACEKLNLPFCVCVNAPLNKSLQTQVVICKLHGNLKENSGNKVTQSDIGTTMSAISKKNIDWLEYIKKIMQTHDMCIWGYSGRDIDYFPFLLEYANMKKRFFWTIGDPKKSEVDKLTEVNASSLPNVRKIIGYPSHMKNELIKVLSSFYNSNDIVQNILNLIMNNPVSTEAKEQFLKEIELSIDATDIYFDSDIFWMLLMKVTGQNKVLGNIIRALLERNKEEYNSLTDKEKFRLLDARIFFARERADFFTYRQIAKELKKKAKKSGLPDEEKRKYSEIAKVQYVSSLQMCVPSALTLKVPLLKKRYGLLLLVRIGYAFLNHRFRCNKELYSNNQFLAQECEIRSLAIDCKVPFFKKRTREKLRNLRNRAYDIGNYATIIGANKYLAQLEAPDKYEQEIKSFGTIVSDLSALSIINRDINPDKALEYAKENDNTLNIVKAIFAKKSMINKGINMTISNDEKRLLFDSIQIITPKSLRKTLFTIGKRENLFLEQ